MLTHLLLPLQRHDGDQALHSAMLRYCEGESLVAACAGRQQGEEHVLPLAQRLEQAAATAYAGLEGVAPEEAQALLHGGVDIHVAAERLLGMRLFLGGVSHAEYHRWAAATGFVPAGAGGAA